MNLNPNDIKQLLESGHAFMRPDRILSDLEPSVAVNVPDGAVHSIAAHVAHMAWWQRQVLQDIHSQAEKRERIAGNEFPETVTLEAWPAVMADFLAGVMKLKAICDDPEALERQYLKRDHAVGAVLLDFAIHNAYHLGQVVLLRRLQGAWPPTSHDPNTW